MYVSDSGRGERHACHVLGQPRSTQRRVKKVRVDESALRTDVIRLASRFGRYGYRQITNLLRIEGWEVNHKRVERIWRQEGLKVPRRQPKRGRLWLNDGSCIRLRPLHKNHVWSYDFVSTRTHDGRALKLLTVLDEYTRMPNPSEAREPRCHPAWRCPQLACRSHPNLASAIRGALICRSRRPSLSPNEDRCGTRKGICESSKSQCHKRVGDSNIGRSAWHGP